LNKITRLIVVLNVSILLLLAFYYFLAPALLIVKNLNDPAIREGRIPQMAWNLHKSITPGFGKWARERVESRVAANLDLYDVPSTEWPIFGSVFYLMATENLQKEWEANNVSGGSSPDAPKVYARSTIDAAVDLVMDPVHHTWVETHWGTNYLHRENVFFRSLLIAAAASYENLTGSRKYRSVLEDQCVTLAGDLDASKYGVLDDYPGECYPIDVFFAVMMIDKAGRLAGIDQSGFVKRSIRAFEGPMLDKLGLPPYTISSITGKPEMMCALTRDGEAESSARGIGNSYVLIFARDIWPDVAKQWYASYEKNFWQDLWWASGFRELPKDPRYVNWGYDVDAGPILGGFSPAANAYAMPAAVVNGRLDHSYTLLSECIAASWPLPSGRLMGPALLSDQRHAPYLGEANLLWLLSYTKKPDVELVSGGKITFYVYFIIALHLLAFLLVAYGCVKKLQYILISGYAVAVWPNAQSVLWLLVVLAGAGLLYLGSIGSGMILVLLAQLLPRLTVSSLPINQHVTSSIEVAPIRVEGVSPHK